MPDFGTLNLTNHPNPIPAASPAYPPPPWPLPKAEIFQISFEIDKEQAIRWLPAVLSRPNPAYAHLTIARYPSSPVGPFSLAHQFIVSRMRVLARAFPFQTIVDNVDALCALREVWGFPAKLGKVTMERKPQSFEAVIERPAGRALVKASITELEPVTPAEIRYDPMMNLRLTPPIQDGKPPEYTKLVQIDPHYDIRECFRGLGAIAYPNVSQGDSWHVLEPRNIICATWATCDTELPWARFVEEFTQQQERLSAPLSMKDFKRG